MPKKNFKKTVKVNQRKNTYKERGNQGVKAWSKILISAENRHAKKLLEIL